MIRTKGAKMKDKILANGILIRVLKNNKEVFQFVIPPNCIFMTQETINKKDVELPVVCLTQNYTPLTAEDICNHYLGKPDDTY
jgi:hypothetical protein